MNDIPEHTRDVLDEETISELSAEQTHKVCETILGYSAGFLVPEGKTWRTEMIDHGLDVQNWPVPETVTQVRQILGFAAYYRKFIYHFSKIAQPLTTLTKKSVRFHWNGDCQNAFETLKQLLVTAPVLADPLSEGEYILDTDASNFAMGAVLTQVQNGEERVIAYASQTLYPGQ